MITFYPGPSKVYPELPFFLTDAYNSGILSANHRSNQFMDLCEKTIHLLHQKLNIPRDYSILFVSSATECWEIISQSFTHPNSDCKTLHFYNGSFGKKWKGYASRLNHGTESFYFYPESEISYNHIDKPEKYFDSIFCLTQNETSNGTQVGDDQIKSFRDKFKNSLIAIDATSSLGGINLQIENADIWFTSVQKCLGLPAGMGILIVSPKAVQKAKIINDSRFYNSFLFMYENIQKFQTHYTPNVLSIYLLMRVMETVENVSEIDLKIKKRSEGWTKYFNNHLSLKLLIENNSVRSDTIITVTADSTETINTFKEKSVE